MKLVCEKDKLVNAVNVVARVASNRTTMPILECLLLEAKDSKVTLLANNLELNIETNLDCDVKDDGVVAMEARLFSEIIAKMPSGDIAISTGKFGDIDFDNIMDITCGKAKFQLACQNAKDFPIVKDDKSKHDFTVAQSVLKSMIRQTIFCTSPTDTNKLMTGELLEINKDEHSIKLTALDGYRIAIREHCRTSGGTNKCEITSAIIPAKTLTELARLLSDDGDVQITIAYMFAIFEFSGITAITRLIDGDYFNISQVTHHDFSEKVIVNRLQLLDSFERATLLNQFGDKVPVLLKIEGDKLAISIKSSLGSMNEVLDAETGLIRLTIGFNAKFIIEALKAIAEDTVELYFDTPKSPMFIESLIDKYMYAILPVNIG